MENLTVAEAAKKIKIYLNQNNFRPYFVISDNAAKFHEMKKFLDKDFAQVYISEICVGDFFFGYRFIF